MTRELAGEGNRNIMHIMKECGVDVSLRGNVHISQMSKTQLAKQRLPLHFLVRAPDYEAMENAQELLTDLIHHIIQGMIRRARQ